MDQTGVQRAHNFSAGPAALPLPALEAAQREFLALPGAGASVMEISHRGKEFAAVHEQAKDNLKRLLNLPDHYKVLFMQGGATMQFSLIAMNFLAGSGKPADYILTGSWGAKAIKAAQLEGTVQTAWSGKDGNFVRVPNQDELTLDPNAAYTHFTSNETIQGVQFFTEPETGDVPLICDASSDFLCRPLPIQKYAMIYAGAQKNVGPSGVVVVIVREDLLDRVRPGLHPLMDYKDFAANDSLANTPPTFGIYMVGLVTKWLLEDIGGLGPMEALNRKKAALLYDVIDQSGGFYRGHAEAASRSIMNVTWRLPSEELEAEFVQTAKAANMVGLKGHRSVGGIRASIYNAVPLESVEVLAAFMREFQQSQG